MTFSFVPPEGLEPSHPLRGPGSRPGVYAVPPRRLRVLVFQCSRRIQSPLGIRRDSHPLPRLTSGALLSRPENALRKLPIHRSGIRSGEYAPVWVGGTRTPSGQDLKPPCLPFHHTHAARRDATAPVPISSGFLGTSIIPCLTLVLQDSPTLPRQHGVVKPMDDERCPSVREGGLEPPRLPG